MFGYIAYSNPWEISSVHWIVSQNSIPFALAHPPVTPHLPQEAQLSHIQRSVESVRAQKTAREAQSQALGLQAAANQLLQELYHDSEAMELTK